MTTILLKALSYLFLIFMGYFLKKKGKLKLQDKDTLGAILMYITLPCAFVANFRNFQMSSSLFLFFIFGLLLNLGLTYLGKFFSLKYSPEVRAEYMIQSSGQNIGAFTTPFVGSVMDPFGTVVTSIFDIGNSIIAIGMIYPIAIKEVLKEKQTIKDQLTFILNKLFSSVPFDTYLFMLIISLVGIRLPAEISDLAQMLGAPSIIITMIMIGISLEINISSETLLHVVRILLLRYSLAFVLILLIRNLSFLSSLEAQALCYCVCAPTTSISPTYANLCGCDAKIYGAVSSISIVISLFMFIALTAL